MSVIVGGIVLGLLVGSFLTVVIYRLPVMLEREWRRSSLEVLAAAGNDTSPANTPEDTEPFNLVQPRSRCQNCGAQVKAWQNIPVVSWLLLRGRCANCATPISARYPVIELITGGLSGLVVWQFGSGFEAAAVLLLVWSLTALTMIDIDHCQCY